MNNINFRLKQFNNLCMFRKLWKGGKVPGMDRLRKPLPEEDVYVIHVNMIFNIKVIEELVKEKKTPVKKSNKRNKKFK